MPTLFPSPSTTVEAKHHQDSFSSATSSNASALAQNQDPIRRSLSYIDRDSAIALGTILIFILATAGYCIHLRIRQRQRADVEGEAERARRASTGAWRSYGTRSRAQEAGFRDRVRSRAISRGSLPRGSFSTLRGSVSGLWKKNRTDSWPTSSSISSGATTRVGSVDDIPLPDACAWHHHGRVESMSRAPSPHSPYRSRAPSTRSHHCRHSSVHDIPDPILEDLWLRRSSTQRRQERRSSAGLGRRGSATHVERRFSVLESIAEPGPCTELPARAMSCEAAGTHSSRRFVRGSRSGYDWSRPTAGAAESEGGGLVRVEVQKHNDFKRVIWGNERIPKDVLTEIGGDVTQCEDTGGEEVTRKDWASGPHDL